MCFRCSKESSHRDGSFEYLQHMFWLKIKKNNFHLRTLIWGPDTNHAVQSHAKANLHLCYFHAKPDFLMPELIIMPLV